MLKALKLSPVLFLLKKMINERLYLWLLLISEFSKGNWGDDHFLTIWICVFKALKHYLQFSHWKPQSWANLTHRVKLVFGGNVNSVIMLKRLRPVVWHDRLCLCMRGMLGNPPDHCRLYSWDPGFKLSVVPVPSTMSYLDTFDVNKNRSMIEYSWPA